MPLVGLEPGTPQHQVKHFTTEPLGFSRSSVESYWMEDSICQGCGSVVLDSLLIVAPIVYGVLCFVLVFICSTYYLVFC